MAILAGSPVERLPEELLLHILTYLENDPPSQTNLREEPSLELFRSHQQPLKHVSTVSKQWRRLGLPLLFKHARLRLDGPLQQAWGDCACGGNSMTRRLAGLQTSCDDRRAEQFHLDLVEDAVNYLQNEDTHATSHDRQTASDAPTARHIFFAWAPSFYHTVDDFLAFVKHNDLATKVESFILMTGNMLSGKLDRFPHRAAGADRDWRYRCAAALWPHLLAVLDLQRIVVLAPPTDLACLTNSAIDTFGDWAFGDMAFHILDLRLDEDSRSTSPLLGKTVEYAMLDHTPRRYPGIAGSSILNLRPWHHITINEGAYLKAYGTYEYFERGPPSLIYSIKDCLIPRSTYSANVQRLSRAPLASLQKLTYIGIFPFANHLDFRELLPQLEELDLQLAPTSSTHGRSILNDPSRVGKAELQDCWSELITIYQTLANQLATFRITEGNMPRLSRLLCRDMERKALHEELDDVFIGLCLPVWAEMEDGVF
ncbi:hypothetical protein LTR53_017664, partial [Teratosphaeriaceae sp. CCFEE 6253]